MAVIHAIVIHCSLSVIYRQLSSASATASTAEIADFFTLAARIAEYQEEKDNKPKYSIIAPKTTAVAKKSHMFSTPFKFLVFQ